MVAHAPTTAPGLGLGLDLDLDLDLDLGQPVRDSLRARRMVHTVAPDSKVLVIGSEADRQRLCGKLAWAEDRVHERDWADVDRGVADGVRAIVVAGHPPSMTLLRLVRSLVRQVLARRSRPCPITIISPVPLSPHRAWALYNAGASLVVTEQVGRRVALGELIRRHVVEHERAEPSRTVDARLADLVDHYLELAGVDVGHLALDVQFFELVVTSDRDPAADRVEFCRMLEELPGVRAVRFVERASVSVTTRRR